MIVETGGPFCSYKVIFHISILRLVASGKIGCGAKLEVGDHIKNSGLVGGENEDLYVIIYR
jgi:hypothetical protein